MRSFASGTPLSGRYVLVDELAKGPDATVWRGLDDVLGRPVAVKLFTSAVNDEEARAWIHLRARTAARLVHPHAAAVYDFGDAPALDGSLVPYVVLELLDGVPLAERLAEGPLPWPLSVRTAAEVAGALAAAHARGVVHGEVTPRSVLLTPAGAKLIGFAGPSRAPLVEFAPPDDVRGLGVVLGHALLGTAPHAGTEPDAFGLVDGLPSEVPPACLACLALRAGDRPAAEEVLSTLAGVVTRFAATAGPGEERLLVPVPPRKPAPAARSTLRWPRLNRVQLGLAAALVGVLTLSGVATGVSGALLSSVVGRSHAKGSPSTATAPRITSVRPGGAPVGGPANPPSTPEPAPSANASPTPTGSPEPTPEPSASPTPSPSPPASPSATPLSAAEALAWLRATVDDGRTASEITEETAVELDGGIDELARAFSADRVVALHWRIDIGVTGGTISASRGVLLHTALTEYAELGGYAALPELTALP